MNVLSRLNSVLVDNVRCSFNKSIFYSERNNVFIFIYILFWRDLCLLGSTHIKPHFTLKFLNNIPIEIPGFGFRCIAY